MKTMGYCRHSLSLRADRKEATSRWGGGIRLGPAQGLKTNAIWLRRVTSASCQGRRFARTHKLVKFGSKSRKHSRRRLSLMPISALHGQQYGWIQLFLGRSLTKFSLAQFTNPFKFNTQIRRPISLSLCGVVANSSRISSPDVGRARARISALRDQIACHSAHPAVSTPQHGLARFHAWHPQ